MDGRTVILQASRKLPSVIRELLERNPDCDAVDVFFGDTELFRVKQRLR